jgi:hypothetical protein
MDDPTPPAEGPAMAVDLGYRLKPEGVRVAYWCDRDECHGEVVVAISDLHQLRRVRSLRSTCDGMRDAFLRALVEWTAGRDLTDEWKQQTTTLAQWRSGDRVAQLIRWWSEHRLGGDEGIFASAAAWRKQYLHLANWWRNLENQIRARLREQYRVFAANVARRYCTLYIEEFDLLGVSERPDPESGEVTTASSSYRQMVSPSAFRQSLVSACSREGVSVVAIPAQYTTRMCYLCGHASEWDQAASIVHRCEQCGQMWDQDYNAARNLLALGLAGGGAAASRNRPVRRRKWDWVRERSQKKPNSGAGKRVTVEAVEMPAWGLGT